MLIIWNTRYTVAKINTALLAHQSRRLRGELNKIRVKPAAVCVHTFKVGGEKAA